MWPTFDATSPVRLHGASVPTMVLRPNEYILALAIIGANYGSVCGALLFGDAKTKRIRQ